METDRSLFKAIWQFCNMADFRIVVGDPASKKSYQKAIEPEAASALYGMKIGETVRGETFGLDGYEFVITGGTDKNGFPMRADARSGAEKIKPLLTAGVGFHPEWDGERKKKTVHVNNVDATIAQLNLKVTKAGSKSLEELMPKKEQKEKK